MDEAKSPVNRAVTRRRVLAGALALSGAAVFRQDPTAAAAATTGRLGLTSTLPEADRSTGEVLTGLREGFARAYPAGRIDIGAGGTDGKWLLGTGSWSHATSLAAENPARHVFLLNFGENVRRDNERLGQITELGASLWRANFAAGRWAAQTLGRTAVLAMSFRESGYDAADALRAGFESAGGAVLAVHITHRPRGMSSLSEVAETVRTSKAEVVLAAYSGSDARDFLGLRPSFGDARLVVSGLFFGSAAMSPAADGAYLVSPWSADSALVAGSLARTLGAQSGRQLAQFTNGGHSGHPPLALMRVNQGQFGHLGTLMWDGAAQQAERDLARSVKTGWTTPYLELLAGA